MFSTLCVNANFVYFYYYFSELVITPFGWMANSAEGTVDQAVHLVINSLQRRTTSSALELRCLALLQKADDQAK